MFEDFGLQKSANDAVPLQQNPAKSHQGKGMVHNSVPYDL
jgi:hypothetical protein